MTRIFFLLLLAFLSSNAQRSSLEIKQLTGDFYIYTTFNDFNGTLFPANGMYVISGQGAILIDTPWDQSQFQPLLDSIYKRHGKKVTHCIATHYHDDRTAGLEYFASRGIKTYSSGQTRELCRKHGEKQARYTFAKDTVFSIGGKRFETFYAGEGHTPDNLSVWFPSEKILYGGCLIKSTENSGLGNIADANLNAWPTTIRRLLEKYPVRNYVIPGHFGWDDKSGLEHTLHLLEQAAKR